MLLVIVAACVGVAVLLAWFVRLLYSLDRNPQKDTVIVYSTAKQKQENSYRKFRGLKVEADREDCDVLLSDIPGLAEQESVQEIYLVDGRRIEAIAEESRKTGAFAVYSFPEKLMAADCVGTEFGKLRGEVTEGGIPRDGAGEAVITASLAEKLGVDPVAPDGATILVDGKAYTVIGVGPEESESEPAAYISYEEGRNLGAYRYAPETWEEYLSGHNEAAYGADEEQYDTILFHITGSGEELTDYLAQQYPACRIDSAFFVEELDRAVGAERLLYTVLVCLLPFAVLEAVTDALLSAGERKTMRRRTFGGADERQAFRKEFRRNIIPFCGLMLIVGIGVILWGAAGGLGTSLIITLIVMLLIATGLSMFMFFRGGAYAGRARQKR